MKKLLILIPLLLTLFACSSPTPPQALNFAPIAIEALENEHTEPLIINRVDYVIADIHYLTTGVQTYREVISTYYIIYQEETSDTLQYAAVEIFSDELDNVEIYTYDNEADLNAWFNWYKNYLSDKENFRGEYRVDYTTANGRLTKNEINTAQSK